MDSERLTSFLLFREQIVIVSKKAIDPKRIHEEPWVSFDPNCYLTPYAKKKSERIIQVESINTAMKLVQEGVGVSMVPSHLIPNPEKFFIHPVKQFNKEKIWATTLNFEKIPKHFDSFLKLLRREASKIRTVL